MSFSKLKRLNRSKFISPGPDVDPAFSGNLDSWPHIKELIHTYKTDWIYPEFKYGHFYPIPPPEFEPQIFEQEDSNLEAELNLSQISLTKQDSLRFSHANGHDLPSGKHGVTSADANGAEEVEKKCIEKPKFNFKHLGGSPLSAYDPVFNWDMERATVAGQRVRVPPNMGTSGMRFSVKVLSLSMSAGHAEPVYGTISLYHREKKEKLSEDFYFQFLPQGWPGANSPQQRRVIFSLDNPSPQVFLLVQLERAATEDGGVKAQVYSRKEPSALTDAEINRVRVWANMMPWKEALAYTTIPLFDPSYTLGLGGFGVLNSPMDSPLHTVGDSFSMGDGRFDSSPGQAVTVDVPVLNRIKECYTEETLHDPKRKAHKPVRASMKFEVERLPQEGVSLRYDDDFKVLFSGPALTQMPSFSGTLTQMPSFSGTSTPRRNSFSEDIGRDAFSGRLSDHSHSGSLSGLIGSSGGLSGSLREQFSGPLNQGMNGSLAQQHSGPLNRDGLPTSAPLSGSGHHHSSSAVGGTSVSGPIHCGGSTPFLNGPADSVMGNTSYHESLRTQGSPALVDYSSPAYDTFFGENNVVCAMDFRALSKSDPRSRLVHMLYVYPQAVTLSKKRNIFVQLELCLNDSDVKKPGEEAIYPRNVGEPMQRLVWSQVAPNTKTALFHDEFKVQLPMVILPDHHLLFTFFHVELERDANGRVPKPVVVGYSVLPLVLAAQMLKSDGSLPIIKEPLLKHYTKDHVKVNMEYLEEGRPVFRLRLRLCSSIYPVDERIRDFFSEYDNHVLGSASSTRSGLLETINNLKNMDPMAMVQFLQPILNMLLRMVGDCGETLQVAPFRAIVNILTRVQQESQDGAERNRFLVQFVDYAFDDHGDKKRPIYPGLCSVWRSLARSKAKGYRVGPVYDDVLTMAWVFLELIVKSMALEHHRPPEEQVDPDALEEEDSKIQLSEDIFRCIWQLFDCLLTEVHERAKKGLPLAKRLNSHLAFFCHDLLSIVDSRQVFELVALYMDKFTGMCQHVIHECKLTFLRIVCDHDLYIEMPGRAPIEKNYLTITLLQEVILSLDHEDMSQRTRAARMLAVLLCKHENDVRYQRPDDKLYIAHLYYPFVGLIFDEVSIYFNLHPSEKREMLICVLSILRNLDLETVVKLWQQSEARTRLFFKFMEECLTFFEQKLVTPGSAPPPATPDDDASGSPKYTEKLAPSTNHYFADAARQDNKFVIEGGFSARASPQRSPSQSFSRLSIRESISQISLSKKEASRVLREALQPSLRQEMSVWEGNLCVAVSLQTLELLEIFSAAVSRRSVTTDYGKLECISSTLTALLTKAQSLDFWRVFIPIFAVIMDRHAEVLLGNSNDRFLKEVAFHLMRLCAFRNDSLRKRAVVGWYILLRNSFLVYENIARMKVMLTITLSELMSDVRVLKAWDNGAMEETWQARQLRHSIEQLGSEESSKALLAECGLPPDSLRACLKRGYQGGDDVLDMLDNRWDWGEVQHLRNMLLNILDASIDHSREVASLVPDKYSVAESYCSLAWAYSHVPDLHIMWLLHLCESHQEHQSWAEAAQCAVCVAGVILQALVGRSVWGNEHVEVLRRICPMLSAELGRITAEIEGYGSSKLTVDTAVKYIQMANKFFAKAELFHFCADLLELLIPVQKCRHAYGQLAKCHLTLSTVYDSIVEQESCPIPVRDANYYRVGFYGRQFGRLDMKEFVYREPRDVRLGDVVEKLTRIYEPKIGGHNLNVFPDSRTVDPKDLQAGMAYLQITSVEPLPDNDEDSCNGPAAISTVGLSVGGVGAGGVAAARAAYSLRRLAFSRFIFDTPFTKNGKTQGGLEDQWKRRTVLITEGSFPSVVNRLMVLNSESKEFSPAENATDMIMARTQSLISELEASNSATPEARLSSLQRLLQGSVAVQVNSGILGVCMAFYKTGSRFSEREIQKLTAALVDFMGVCRRAIKLHAQLIGDEDQEFHSQLVLGFKNLSKQLAHYVPSILAEA